MQNISKDTIVRAAKGDVEAFEEIYSSSSGYVYTLAYRVTNNREDAQEATQDAFLRIYKSLAKFEFRSSLKTWIYRIAVNAAINLINRRKKRTEKTVTFEDSIGYEETVEEDNEIIDRETKDNNEKLVESMMKILSPEQRACLVLKDIEGLKYREIAETLKISLNTVRTRIKRGREKLISRYAKRGGIK